MKRLSKWLKKYFIPHHENEFKPHFLRHETMMFFFLLIIVAELAFLIQVFVIFDKTNFLASVLPGVLTSLTNEERAQNDAPPLVENELLAKAAQMKAEDMATYGYFAHTSPEGKTPWYWFEEVGYKYVLAGENLAVNFFESDDVAQAWMDSPTHRANIVKKDYTEIGIGTATGVYQGRNTVFVAQLFGTPMKVYVPEKASAPAPEKTEPEIAPIKEVEPEPIKPIPAPTPAPVVAPTPTPTPATPVNPNTIAVAPVVAPVATQILGEETNSPAPSTMSTTNNSRLTNFRSFIQRILTSPRQYLAYTYATLAFAVILVLLIVLFVKSEIRHPAIMVRGLALVTTIVLLLFFNMNMLNLKTSVDTVDLSANAISLIAP